MNKILKNIDVDVKVYILCVNYQPLDHPMVVETASRVISLIEYLYDDQFIDETTMEWLLQTPTPL